MQVFFDKSLESEFAKIYARFKDIELKDDQLYQADLKYLTSKLQVFDPFPSVFENDNFSIAAIDGSGAESLVSLNDIAIHLMTAAFAADETWFNKGTTKQIDIIPPLCSHPEGVIRLVLLREDNSDEVWDEFKTYINYNYGEELLDVVIRVIGDIVADAYKRKHPNDPVPKLDTKQKIIMTAKQINFKLYKDDIEDFTSWMVSPGANAPRGWYDQFREVIEYALANALIESKVHFKYVFLDGSMNMLMSPNQLQPRLAANYLLRDLCLKALKKDTCVVAVSKTTTFPFVYRIAQDLEKNLGAEKKWFIRVPNQLRDNHTLNILKDRPHIPPAYGVTYLFHFSSEVPILRIDIDEKWWKEKIFDSDKKKQRDKEIKMFQEIDWLARDVRYYGYFFDLAFAHHTTLVKFSERDVVADQLTDYFVNKGEDPKMFIHPRKRLGLM
jgi:hypothetical protein